jgi:hypothetical protein
VTLFFGGGNMKLASILLLSAGIALLTGCEPIVPSLLSVEPVATAKDSAIDPSLIGTWEQQGEKDLLAIVRPADLGGYQIAVLSGGSVLTFQAKLFRVKQSEFLDLAPSDDNDFRIPGHAIARVWMDGAAFRSAFLDSDWFKQQCAALITHSGGDKMQLFSPTAAIRALLDASGESEKAYGKVITWTRAQ